MIQVVVARGIFSCLHPRAEMRYYKSPTDDLCFRIILRCEGGKRGLSNDGKRQLDVETTTEASNRELDSLYEWNNLAGLLQDKTIRFKIVLMKEYLY
jgi:hypothetical protein